MNLKRYMFIVLILFLCMISVSAVSAADNDASGVIINTDNGLALDECINDDVLSSNDDEIISDDSNVDGLVGSANDNEALGERETGSFIDLDHDINGDENNNYITLKKDYKYVEGDDAYVHGIEIRRSLTIDGNGSTIDGNYMARIFKITANDVTITNITFINGNATGTFSSDESGGAIYWKGGNGKLSGSNFNNNNAISGGAIYWNGGNGKLSGSNFNNNNAISGGAIYWKGTSGTVTNSSFTDNEASPYDGGAIYWNGGDGNVAGSNFNHNIARNGGAIHWSYSDGNVTGSNFNHNIAWAGGGAIQWFYSVGNVTGSNFYNNSASSGGAIEWFYSVSRANNNIFLNNGASVIRFISSDTCNIDYNWFGNTADNYTVSPHEKCNVWLFLNGTANPNELDVSSSSQIIFKLSSYDKTSINDTYYNSLLYPVNLSISSENGDTNQTFAQLGESVTYNANCRVTGKVTAQFEDTVSYAIQLKIIGFDPELSFESQEVTYNGTTTINVKYNESADGKVNVKLQGENRNYTIAGLDLSSSLLLGDIDSGIYAVTVEYLGNGEFENVNATGTLTVKKIATEITPNDSTIKLFVGDNTLVKYSLNPSEASGEISFTSSNPNVVTVDSDGNIKAVGAGTATITISLTSANYEAQDATVTITVSKKDSQITASAKSYKFEDKTKTYTVTLKDKKGNVLKNKKVSLKVAGTTYTATTNNKGVATFKLTKLTKQGTFTAVITYAGDKYYNKATKNAKLTVKAPAWKTVSKGSKDKAMVKKIQKALKSNGYYLSYKGRYLKIDGLFHKYTQMAVKQFQKTKKLKVTGKVDYATAKKLKLI